MEVETRTIYIDSDNLTNKVGNDEVYIENQIALMRAGIDEYIDVELVSFVARNDFYQMTDSNNAFGIRQNSSTTTYNLTNGFPSVLSIDNELKADLESATGETWSVTYSNYTAKITMSATYSGAIPADLALDFSVTNTAALMLGFNSAIYAFSIDGQNVTLTAPNAVNLSSRVKNMYIRTSLIEDQYEANVDGLDSRDILASIPVDVSPLNYLSFTNNTDSYRSHIKGRVVGSFNVRITNRENELIGLNSGFQIVLRFYKMKRPDDATNMILKRMLDIQELKWLSKEERKKPEIKQYPSMI